MRKYLECWRGLRVWYFLATFPWWWNMSSRGSWWQQKLPGRSPAILTVIFPVTFCGTHQVTFWGTFPVTVWETFPVTFWWTLPFVTWDTSPSFLTADCSCWNPEDLGRKTIIGKEEVVSRHGQTSLEGLQQNCRNSWTSYAILMSFGIKNFF